jgi:hypothetical protein
VVLLVGGVTTALLLTRDDGASSTPAGTGTPRQADVDEAARDRAIRAVVDRRAEAVLERDRAAFLADVDTRDPDFVAAQERLYDNLRRVDFASWEYEMIGRDYDRPDLASTYDDPYHLPALLVHYAIDGFDVAPVARPQVLTFLQRGKRWLIASDTDADSDLPETGHADPWDRRAVVVGEGDSVLVVADAEDREELPSLVRVSDRAVRRVAQMWPDGWRRKVVVVAVRDQQLVETYFRTALQSSENVAAIAVPAYDVVPGWSPPRDSGEKPPGPRSRVILNPRYFDPDDDANADLLTHEVTHVATQARTLAGSPTWLSEGAAEYTAYRYLRPFSVRLPPSLARQVRSGSVDLPTYDFYQRDVAANYLAGFLACAYVAEEYGEDVLRRLYDDLARTPNEIQTVERQEQVFRRVLDVTPEQLSREVAAYARTVAD